jgi:hypothetical protein
MEQTECTIKHSTPTGTFFTATEGNRTFRVPPDTETDAFIVFFTIKAGEGSKRTSRSSSTVMESDLRQRRGAALLNKVAAFANQAWSRRCRLHCTAAARPTPAPVAPVPQVAFDPFHLVTAMNDAIAVKGILKDSGHLLSVFPSCVVHLKKLRSQGPLQQGTRLLQRHCAGAAQEQGQEGTRCPCGSPRSP